MEESDIFMPYIGIDLKSGLRYIVAVVIEPESICEKAVSVAPSTCGDSVAVGVFDLILSEGAATVFVKSGVACIDPLPIFEEDCFAVEPIFEVDGRDPG